MSRFLQVVLLDVLGAPNPDDVASHVGAGLVLLPAIRLSEHSPPAVQRGGPVDWDGLASAIARMAESVRQVTEDRSGNIELAVAGLAPLPAFALLGAELSAWAPPTVLVNQRKEGEWDILRLHGHAANRTTYFAPLPPEAPRASPATGHVVVTVASRLNVLSDHVQAFCEEHGYGIAGEIDLHGDQPLGEGNAPVAARELAEALGRAQREFPRASGVVMFVAGPATLAYLAGRAFNPNVFRTLVLPNFSAGEQRYEAATVFPNSDTGIPDLDNSDDAAAARERAVKEITSGMEEFRDAFELIDLPDWLEESHKHELISTLEGMELVTTLVPGEFNLSIQRSKLSLGDRFVDPLKSVDPAVLRALGPAFLIHEALHPSQNLLSSNYVGVGRAEVALELVDYWADAVALRTSIAVTLRKMPAPDFREVVEATADAHLATLLAFDQYAQPERLRRLPVRRLRRYLIWLIQHARLVSARDMSHVDRILRDRLVAEIAPVEAVLDARGDRVLRGVPEASELFIVAEKRLVRLQSSPAFKTTTFVEAVREYDISAAKQHATYVVETQRGVLAPWSHADLGLR